MNNIPVFTQNNIPKEEAIVHVRDFKYKPSNSSVKLPYETLKIKLEKPLRYETSIYTCEVEEIIIDNGNVIKCYLIGDVSEDRRPQEFQVRAPMLNQTIIHIVHVEEWASDEPRIYTVLDELHKRQAHKEYCNCNEINACFHRGDVKLKNITLDEADDDYDFMVCPQVKSNVNFILGIRTVINKFHEKEFKKTKSKKHKRKTKFGESPISVYRPVKTQNIYLNEQITTKRTRHRYRYFVRGHYRRIKHGLVWVKAHERGVKNGFIINKDYIL